MKYQHITTALSLISALLLGGCATTPPLTPEQRRSMETHTFNDTSYDNVFHAVKSVLQDDGYVIKNQDSQGGLIVGTIQKSVGSDYSGFSFGPIGTPQPQRDEVTNQTHEVSINMEKISDSIIETRVSIQELDQYRYGGQRGHQDQNPQSYNSFFQKLAREVERRKAQGKG